MNTVCCLFLKLHFTVEKCTYFSDTVYICFFVKSMLGIFFFFLHQNARQMLYLPFLHL